MSDVTVLIPDDFGRGELSPRPDAFVPGRLSGETMGTDWSARWFAPEGVHPRRIESGIQAAFTAIIADMSSWELDSALSRYNRLPAGQSMPVSTDFAVVMDMALDIAGKTSGAFDPCLGSEVVRRGFGPVGIQEAQASLHSGESVWSIIKPSAGALFQPGGVVLDLSGIAKGYAVDRMAGALAEAGVSQFLVEIGGEFAGRGVKPDGLPWWVDLETPRDGSPSWRLALCGQAVATSGDYRQMRSVDGVTQSHIIPVPNRRTTFGELACVSVLHATCAEADAWATALFALGDAGVALADAQGIAALFQYRDAAPRLSARMAAFRD